MPEAASDMTMGEIARTLVRLDDGQKEVLAQITLMRGEFVHRTEWEMRNRHVDERFQTLGREVGDMRAKHEADITAVRNEAETSNAANDRRRAPWWSVVGAVGTGFTILLAIIYAVAQQGA